MNGLIAYAGMMLRLQFRYRLAVFYSFLFPLVFLVAFRVLYRWQVGHIIQHLGELLAIAILGGTCFGLPVTMVAERERGVWRRYHLLPTPIWSLVAGTIGVRFVLLGGAGLLQLLVAKLMGMRSPDHLPDLIVAFSVVSFAFCGFGLIVAMLVNSVAAAQALGQCIFLPMLVLGGMTGGLTILPEWTRDLATFAPGRYAVRALQVGGVDQGGLPGGLAAVRYDLAVLLFMGTAACVSAAMMFRWDVRSGHERGRRIGWLGVTLAACLTVGFVTQRRESVASSGEPAVSAPETPVVVLAPPPAPVMASVLPPPAPLSTAWQSLRRIDLEQVDRAVPPDDGVVAPIAGPADVPDPATKDWVEQIRGALVNWAPARTADPVQRVRNLLYVLAVPDVMQIAPLEQFLPAMVYARLQQEFPGTDLEKLLGWIALHPGEGSLSAADQLIPLGIEVRSDRFDEVRERARLYATKFLIRLQGG